MYLVLLTEIADALERSLPPREALQLVLLSFIFSSRITEIVHLKKG